ncbi:MAG: hypothetical protein AB7I50_00680 [Vicinamibacterales bacterium]
MSETNAEQADILEAMIDWYPLARTKMALRAGAQALMNAAEQQEKIKKLEAENAVLRGKIGELYT